MSLSSVRNSEPLSIIVAAHNEQTVIERCLSALSKDAAPGELEIVVVCNGCTDDTAALVRALDYPVQVIETPIASKPHAINLGDEAATAFPRLYIDADVVIDTESIRRVADVLRTGEIGAAAPRLEVDLGEASLFVRAYYAIWLQLPYARENMIGSGVYAMSKLGRERFARFPDTFADDCFVRHLFQADEKATVESSSFRVRSPRRLRDLVSTLARQIIGTNEVRALYPEITQSERIRQRLAILSFAAKPRAWFGLVTYVGIKLAAQILYRWRSVRGGQRVWTRDDSSRAADLFRSPSTRAREPHAPAAQ